MGKRKYKTRDVYEKYYGVKLSNNLEVHHILPVHAGGTDDPSNLIALTKEQHKDKHLEMYKDTKDFRDLCAYHMIGYNFTEAHKISSSEGGKIGGKKAKELCKGIHQTDPKIKSRWASVAGKVGGRKQVELKMGIHAQTPEERLLLASRGGKKGAFTQSKWQSQFGKRGGPKNKGFVWLTDGKINIKYSVKKQKQITTEDFIKQNPLLTHGRTEPKKTCSVCGKIMNCRSIGRYHNERCIQNDKNQIN